MRTYELMFVLDPRLPEEDTRALCEEYQGMIETAGGRIEHREDWGRRQLAYPIRKIQEGRYFVYHLSSESDSSPTVEVERRMRQKEDVLRYLTVRTEALDFKVEEPAAEGAETAAVATAVEAASEAAAVAPEPAAASAAVASEPVTAAAPEADVPDTVAAAADEAVADPAAAAEATPAAEADAVAETAEPSAPVAGDEETTS